MYINSDNQRNYSTVHIFFLVPENVSIADSKLYCILKNDGCLNSKSGRAHFMYCQCHPPVTTNETTLERADFTLQLLLFVTAEKEGQILISFFCFQILSAVVPVILR